MAKKVVIASACRTAIGKMGGVLSTVPAVDLGAVVIKEAVKRAGLAPEQVDHVYMGNVIQAERSTSGFHQSRITNRDTGSYSKRCMWFWSELR